MIPLSTAMTQTGAAAQLADALVNVVGDSGPYALLLGLFVLTAVLGQLISNMATALIVFPIAISAAQELAVSPRPVLMCVTVSAAAALLTPVATPANLMVMEPGGYRFGGLLEARPAAARALRRRRGPARARLLGALRAGGGNRTRVIGLEGRSSTIELRPRGARAPGSMVAPPLRPGRSRGRVAPHSPRPGLRQEGS